MKYRPALASLAAACMLALAPGLLHAQRGAEPITLNFVNAEIEAVARTMAAITGRNIVVDPRVKGTINLATDRPVPPSTAFNQFVATLRLSGFTVVESVDDADVLIWTTETPEEQAALQADPAVAGLRARQVFTDKELAGAIAYASPLSYPVVAQRLPSMLADALT